MEARRRVQSSQPRDVENPPEDVKEYVKRLRDEGYSLDDIMSTVYRAAEVNGGNVRSAEPDPRDDVANRMGWDGWSTALTVAAFITRFWGLCWPREVVFDEVHFGKFVNGYLKGEYFFDIHPPLGKLILAAFAYFGNYDGSVSWEKIGDPIREHINLFALRMGPALFGTALVPLTYHTSLLLHCSKEASVLAASFVLFDLSLMVESRLVLTDSVLFFCEMAQLYAILRARHANLFSLQWWLFLALAGLGIGGACGTKWTGLSYMGMLGLESIRALLVHILPPYRRRQLDTPSATRRSVKATLRTMLQSPLVKETLGRALTLLVLPAVFYYFLWQVLFRVSAMSPWEMWWGVQAMRSAPAPLIGTSADRFLHFRLLPKSGPGDAFMSLDFRASLENSRVNAAEHPVMSLWQKTKELNAEMLRANANIKTGHGWGSSWLEWPIMRRTIFYWVHAYNNHDTTARIYLMGNPFVWWFCLGGTALSMMMNVTLPLLPVQFSNPTQAMRHRRLIGNCLLLLSGLLGGWLPFMFVHRVAFLYHYLPCLLLSILITACVFDALTEWLSSITFTVQLSRGMNIQMSLRTGLAAFTIFVSALSCWYWCPLAFGWPMTEDQFKARMWIKTWI